MSEKLWRVGSELLGGLEEKGFEATSKGGVSGCLCGVSG